MLFALLAPGPSAPGLVCKIPPIPLGVVGNAYELAPSAAFLVAADRGWWLKHPESEAFAGRKFCNTPNVLGTEFIGLAPDLNSGVLALTVAARLGASQIRLYGFDMHGSHFFGAYQNGLRNTNEVRRAVFLSQYADWARANAHVSVINCTPGSALTCFPMETG